MKGVDAETLGPYELERRIASGGMAEVFVACRRGPHGFTKRVALKRILPQHARDPEFVGMFIDEARLAARLDHPNIVQVFDFGEAERSLFMAMELVEGTTIGKLLRTVASRRETVPIGPALSAAYEAATALAYAHGLTDDKGEPLSLVHRDVSPANLLLNQQGHIKLTDFGIARCRTTMQRTDDGQVRGKLGYMSPEQVVGDRVDAKTDVFTLAVVLTEMLVARPLFSSGGDLEVLLQIRNVDLKVLEKHGAYLPKDIQRLLRWALEKERSDRPNARAFASALSEILARRGELGRGPSQMAALLERLELIPQKERDRRAEEAGARPTFLVELAEGTTATEHTREMLASLAVDPPSTYTVKRADGVIEGPLAYSEVVRRIVTGELGNKARIRRDEGDFETAGRMPELSRYLASNALHWGPSGLPRGATRRGVLFGGQLLSQVSNLTSERKTGVIHLWEGRRQKRIYYLDGRPDFVTSNLGDELLGEFLVQEGSILRMELDMALAMLPRFDGRLGDALVGLGVLRPMELFEAVGNQVRARYLEAFRWHRGQWAFIPEERCEEETIPLRYGEHEMLRDAAMQPDLAQMHAALGPLAQRLLQPNPANATPLSAYRLPQKWERVIATVDGRHTLEQVVAAAESDEEREAAQRAVYLGLSCSIIQAA